MKRMSTEISNRLAAEYVLGTMPARARMRFVVMLKTSPQLRRFVADWEAHLTPLASSIAPLTPPQRVWKAIHRTVLGSAAGSRKVSSAWRPFSWWSSLGFWRTAAGFATITLVVFALLVLAPTEIETVAENPMMVVVMEDTQTQAPAMTVSWEPGGESPRTLRLRVMGHAEMAPDTAWELWLLPARDAAPVSLGLITTHEIQSVRVPEPLAQPLDAAWGLGMTVEPKGGSPSGLPTSPMLYAGQCVMT